MVEKTSTSAQKLPKHESEPITKPPRIDIVNAEEFNSPGGSYHHTEKTKPPKLPLSANKI